MSTIVMLGTGKTDKMNFYVLNQVYNKIIGKKTTINGPNLTGTNTKNRIEDAVKFICSASPTQLNLIGHSRGAIACVAIANEIALYNANKQTNYDFTNKDLKISEINLLLYDPVSRTEAPGDKYTIGPLVRNFFCVAMRNESSHTIFGLQRLKLDSAHEIQKCYLPLPGSHGSAVQRIKGDDIHFPIGELGEMIGCRFLSRCRNNLVISNYSDQDLVEGYFKINAKLKMKNRWDPGSSKHSRTVYDIEKGVPKKRTLKEGKSDTRKTRIDETMGRTYRWHNFFINAHLLHLFRRSYQTLCNEVLKAPERRHSSKQIDTTLTSIKKNYGETAAAVRAVLDNRLVVRQATGDTRVPDL